VGKAGNFFRMAGVIGAIPPPRIKAPSRPLRQAKGSNHRARLSQGRNGRKAVQGVRWRWEWRSTRNPC